MVVREQKDHNTKEQIVLLKASEDTIIFRSITIIIVVIHNLRYVTFLYSSHIIEQKPRQSITTLSKLHLRKITGIL